jgi:hypothetical protein
MHCSCYSNIESVTHISTEEDMEQEHDEDMEKEHDDIHYFSSIAGYKTIDAR